MYTRRLLGWLSYAFASEVFVVVSLTLFLPICLEQFARDNGFLEPDRTSPCTTPGRCSVKIGWLWIDSASFSLYVYSISVALQALTVISMGSIADRPAARKPLLLAFAFAGATSAILFLFLTSTSPLWLLSAVFAICANVGFGASVVAMNAYLPTLARQSPEVVQAETAIETNANANADADTDAVDAPLLGPGAKDAADTHAAALARATARISAQGIAAGYTAGILLLLLALIPVTRSHGATSALRLAIGLSGVWWLVFTIPAALWLPTETGAPSSSSPSSPPPSSYSIRSEIAAAWRRLAHALRPSEVRRVQHTFRYLAAWFLLSDGFASITSTAILFGKTALGMPASALVLVGAITPAAGVVGALAVPVLARRWGWTTRGVLVLLVGLVSLIPAYGCLGFVLPFGGLRTQGEMFGLAVYFGFAFGAFQSYARAAYAELIPPGEEARWYGLYSITDKSSSFIGPLVVGLIADSTGNMRYAFFFLVFMIWLAIPVLLSVDMAQGRIDAETYGKAHADEHA